MYLIEPQFVCDSCSMQKGLTAGQAALGATNLFLMELRFYPHPVKMVRDHLVPLLLYENCHYYLCLA